MRPASRLVALLLVFLVAFSTALWPQSATTSLRGTVSDPNGAVLPGATVTLSNPDTGFTQTTKSDAEGVYQFLQVPPANYSVGVSAPGFSTTKQPNVRLLVNTPATLDFTMQIKGESTTIEVSGAAAPVVNAEDATLGTAFGTSQIQALPFEGRDPVGILSLQPGVAYVGNAVNQDQDSRSGSVNGARSDQTNVMLDGIDNNDETKGYAFQGALRSTLDSLQEFRVTTSNANADAGRSSGAQVTLVTKSGTNSVHGSAYEYHRPTFGVANDWFNKQAELRAGERNVPGKLIRNTFGGTVGGPIIKDKAFFFLAYEGQRTRENLQVTREVPSANLRNGIVSYQCVATDPHCPASGVFTLSAADLATMDPNCTANGTCPLGPGPDPAVLAIFQKYPLPNTDAVGDSFNFRGFTFSAPAPDNIATYIAKFDYNFNQNHRVFVRGGLMDDHTTQKAEVESVQGTAGPQFPNQAQGKTGRNMSKGLVAAYTANFGPNVVNNFRFGYIRQQTDLGGLQTQHFVQFRRLDDIQAFTSTEAVNVPVKNFVDDLTWVKGKHTLQFGTNLRIIRNNRQSNGNSFTAASTNALWLDTAGIANKGESLDPANPAFAAFGFPAVDPSFANGYDFPVAAVEGLIIEVDAHYNLTKTGTTLPEGTPVPRHFLAHEAEWYAQDSWRVTPHLVLTAGLRYTLLQPPYETTGTQSAPSVSLNDFFKARSTAMLAGQTYGPPVSFDLSGQANGRKPYWAWDYKDIAPRLAFAWSPSRDSGWMHRLFGSSGKGSLRGGYGIYYDHFGEGITNTFDKNGSFGLTTVISNPAGQQSVDTAPRFMDLFTIPTSSPGGVLLNPPPSGKFPVTPPTTFDAGGFAIYWGLDDKLKTPYAHVFDLSFERELPKNFVFQAAYVGRLGRRLLQEEDLAQPLNIVDPKSGIDYYTAATQLAMLAEANTPINNIPNLPYWQNIFPTAAGTGLLSGNTAGTIPCAPGTAPANPTATQNMYDNYFCNLHNETTALFNADLFCFPGCATIGGVTGQSQFFDPQWSSLYSWRSIGNSSYNGLQLMLRRRMTNGWQFDFNYTFSKSIDIGSNAERISTAEQFVGASQIINAWSPNQLRGVSDYDTTHQFNFNWIWQMPVGHGQKFGGSWNRLLDGILGGWQLSGLTRWTSGLPTTISDFCCFPTNWELESAAFVVGPHPKTGQFIDKDGDPNFFKDATTALSSFRYAHPGESGQRNNLRGPGYFGIDAGLSKAWKVTESQNVKFSWEVFNVTNAVRFDVAGLPVTNGLLDAGPSFGKYTNTLTKPRVMQLALRYSF